MSTPEPHRVAHFIEDYIGILQLVLGIAIIISHHIVLSGMSKQLNASIKQEGYWLISTQNTNVLTDSKHCMMK